MTRQVVTLVLVAVLTTVHAAPAFAYLKLGASLNGRVVQLRWNHPMRYYVTDRGVNGVDAATFQAALGRAFATWQAVPTSSMTYELGGFTSGLPGDDDGWSTIGFLDEPDLDRVLASTSFLIDEVTGEIIESDVLFNAAFDWSTAVAGESGRFDVETIAVHEIGHMSGLGHSALGETTLTGNGRRVVASGAVMFPIAFPSGTTANRAVRADDVAGISDLYPDGGFSAKTGSVSGRITKSGRGVFGAHVVAFNPSTGAIVGNFALDADGSFSIAGLTPGVYVIRVEPLDDADIDSFLDVTDPPDLDFRVTFFGQLVVVPKGGDSGSIQVKVAPK